MYRKNLQGWAKHIDFMLLDIVLLQLAYVLAFVTRHGLRNPYVYDLYRTGGITLVVVIILFGMIADNYKNVLKRGMFTEFISSLEMVAVSALGLLVYLFFSKYSESFSRLTILYYFVYGLILIYGFRLVYKTILKAKGVGTERLVFVISSKERIQSLLTEFNENSFERIKLVGGVIADTDEYVGGKIEELDVVCSLEDTEDYLKHIAVDEIYINLADGVHISHELMNAIAAMGITTHTVISLYGDSERERVVERFLGEQVITESISVASPGQLFIKRIIDILGGIVGSLITIILMIFVAPAIFIADPGPIFFSQVRVGRNGRKFKIYKFRSMYQDAEARKAELMEKNDLDGDLMFKMENDPRILGSGPDGTKRGIGNFIRKTSIDEFPQFFNVLMGDLSLVGTRPPTTDEWENYEAHHRARLAFKPGITGLWQVSGRSKITDFEEVVKLDMEYINNWTVGRDIRIILETVKVVLLGDGAE